MLGSKCYNYFNIEGDFMMSKRNYGIDLLKIISMYMIAILHVLGKGGVLFSLEELSLEYNLAWLLEIICFCSVNCYAIVTGYVMVNSKFRYKKIINLWLGVCFWSVILTLIMKGMHPDLIGKKDILKSFLPVTFSSYWYFTSYFALFLFMSFINKLISSLDKKSFKRLVVTIIILFCFINLLTDPFKLIFGYSFLWLLAAYFIGAYIKIYNPFVKVKAKWIGLVSLSLLFLTLFLKLLVVKYPKITFGFFESDVLINYNSFTILFASIGLVLLFIKMKFKNKYLLRFIRRLAPATFGVYIIHVQPFVYNLFISNKFRFIISYNSVIMIMLVLFFAFILYMLCSYLEMFRIYLFKKLKINRISDIIFIVLRKVMVKLGLI